MHIAGLREELAKLKKLNKRPLAAIADADGDVEMVSCFVSWSKWAAHRGRRERLLRVHWKPYTRSRFIILQ